jgi:hypothetical protein
MNLHVFGLFDESNFDAYDRQRYPEVLQAGCSTHGLSTEDVLAVTQDFGLWAICKQGIFRADLRGMFKKRIEVGEMIPYSRIMEVQAEQSGLRAVKLVVRDDDSRELAKIEFGPCESADAAAAQCRRILQIMEPAWAKAQ